MKAKPKTFSCAVCNGQLSHTPSIRPVCPDRLRRWADRQKLTRKKNPKHVRARTNAASHRFIARQIAKDPNYIQRTWLKQEYGITLEEYQARLKSQDYLCAICQKPNSSRRNFAVDHDHMTGKIRGLLCSRCNQGIGFLGDTAAGVRAAWEYLIK